MLALKACTHHTTASRTSLRSTILSRYPNNWIAGGRHVYCSRRAGYSQAPTIRCPRTPRGAPVKSTILTRSHRNGCNTDLTGSLDPAGFPEDDHGPLTIWGSPPGSSVFIKVPHILAWSMLVPNNLPGLPQLSSCFLVTGFPCVAVGTPRRSGSIPDWEADEICRDFMGDAVPFGWANY